MPRRGVVVAALTLVTLSPSFALAGAAQESASVTANHRGNPICDREKAGLRGPVRSVEEEQTSAPFTADDGEVYPEFKFWRKTEYDRDGRLAARWSRDSSREHGLGTTVGVTRYTYNPAGQLVRRTWESDGKVLSETVYDYDDKGRLKEITNSSEPDNPIAFRYDEKGRKTKLAIVKPVNIPEGTTAVSRSVQHLFDDESGTMTSWDGGSTATLYDEHDQPIEVQMHNVNGALMSRAIRVYDERGRVIEEKMMMDDPLAMIPATEQRKILEEGATAQQLRDQLAQFLGGSEMWSEKYSYDSQGRKIKTNRNTFNHINESITTSYNGHGDVEREVTHHSASGTGEDPAGDVTRDSDTAYSYEYDANGNWILKKMSLRELPDGELRDLDHVERRTIEYY